ncbi:hypothetical protein TNCV_5000311 [Trichonephila clavipes]|nr:hypothetical protein TNCV_5000311 [Trichonephila clavipes]
MSYILRRSFANLTRSVEDCSKLPCCEWCRAAETVDGEVLGVEDLSTKVGLEGSGSAKKQGFNLSIEIRSRNTFDTDVKILCISLDHSVWSLVSVGVMVEQDGSRRKYYEAVAENWMECKFRLMEEIV